MSEENTLANPIVQKVEVLGFRVSVLGVQLGQSARLAIHLNCVLEGAPFIQYKEIVIEGEEYTAWGADDTYIVELVKNKLTAPAPEPEPAPEPAPEPEPEPSPEPSPAPDAATPLTP